MTQMSAHNYHFARKPTQPETPNNEATTEDAIEEGGDSEFQSTRSDENTPAATQCDDEAKETSTPV